MKRSFHSILFFILSSFIIFTACAKIKELIKVKPIIAPTDKLIPIVETGGHGAMINDILFTSDGKYLVTASDDKTVRVWEVSTGKLDKVFRGQIGDGDNGKIFAAALSPDNRILAVGGCFGKGHRNNTPYDYFGNLGDIRILDLQTGKILSLLKGHRGVIRDIAFSSDGSKLASSTLSQTHIWDIRTGKTIHALKGPTCHVAFSPDATRVITGDNLWNALTGALIASLKGGKKGYRYRHYAKFPTFTPEGKFIIAGNPNNAILLWDGRSGEFIKNIARHLKPYRGNPTYYGKIDILNISADGTRLMTGSWSGPDRTKSIHTVFTFSPSECRIISSIQHTNIPRGVTDISPDGSTAATGSIVNNQIYLWDTGTGRIIKTIGKGIMRGEKIWGVGFAMDGRSIAWGKKHRRSNVFVNVPLDQAFQLWNREGEPQLSLGKALKSDSNYLRAIESVGPLSVRTSCNILEILKNGQKRSGAVARDIVNVYSFTLTPNGKTVIYGGDDGLIFANNPHTGKDFRKFIGHTGNIWGLAVSPNGRMLVSGSDDQTVKLWEVASGELLLTIFHTSDNEWVAWTPEGFFDASPGGAKCIGYVINRGEDKAADYVKVDQVYERFYRPDMIIEKLKAISSIR